MILEEQYVKTLVKHNLTQTQLLGLILIYKHRQDLIDIYNDHFEVKDNIVSDYLSKDLYRRNYLKKVGKKTVLGEKFYDIIIENPMLMIDELYDNYPTFLNVNGVHLPLTAVSRQETLKLYMESIMYSVEEHNLVLKDIKYGKEQNLINTKIDKFINSKFYLSIREKRLKNEVFIENNTEYDEL